MSIGPVSVLLEVLVCALAVRALTRSPHGGAASALAELRGIRPGGARS